MDEKPAIVVTENNFFLSLANEKVENIQSVIEDIIRRGQKDGVAPAYLAQNISEALRIQFGVLAQMALDRRKMTQSPANSGQDIINAALQGVRDKLGLRMGDHIDSTVGANGKWNYGFNVDIGTTEHIGYTLELREEPISEEHKSFLKQFSEIINENQSS